MQMDRIPIKELKELENEMRLLAKKNDDDMREYLLKGNKYHLYIQAKGHRDSNEMWANRVKALIERYEDEK